MMVECRLCRRPVRIRMRDWWGASTWFCSTSDHSGCMATYKALTEQPPQDDPQDPDAPPHDLYVCHVCGGSGEVFDRQDWQTGAIETVTCTWCGGGGDEQ